MMFATSWARFGRWPLTAGLRTGWIALATLLGIVALSAALVSAINHAVTLADDLSRADERLLVERFLARSMEAQVSAEMGLLNWNQAVTEVQNAPTHPEAMTWIDREFGAYGWTAYNLSEAFIVFPDGTLLRGWRGGRPVDAAQYRPLRDTVRTLIARSMADGQMIGTAVSSRRLNDGRVWPTDRSGAMLSRWAGGLLRGHDGPEMISAAAIVPDRAAAQLDRTPAYFVTIRTLDGAAIQRMRRDLILPDLAITPTFDDALPANAIALQAINGEPVGAIRWTAKHPGLMILRSTEPLFWAWTLLFVGVMMGGWAVLKRMWRSNRALAQSEGTARHNALHDAMSGLPNRVHALQWLTREITACIADAPSGEAPDDVFVAYLDIDSFKVVNDTLGHQVGDELVSQLAARLRLMLPPDDFVARFGGDEFVIMRRAQGGRARADQLGRQIMGVMRESFVIAGHSIDATCSCGISWGPTQSQDPGELLRRADVALYRAKQRGRARYRCFTRDMDASVKLRLELEMELRRAIGRGQLTIAYQPIVTVADGAICGVEALLRWDHPERGPIRPDLFVPIAEQGGLMIPLGNWVLRHVFTECRDWPDCDISVNLSPIQIMASDFVTNMEVIVAETGIDPCRIVLEITEGVLLDRSEHVIGVLRALNRIGFRIALDDFGVGYSSLSYLRQFQFERIKIDRSFVSNIAADADAHAILRTIATLGHNLRMKVVAEGVETEIQRTLVAAAGCELVQGFLFWKPMPSAELLPLLDDRHPHASTYPRRLA